MLNLDFLASEILMSYSMYLRSHSGVEMITNDHGISIRSTEVFIVRLGDFDV